MRSIVRHILGFFQYGLIAALAVGCSVRVQPDNAEFDKLCGRGPVLIIPTDETALSTAFFRRHWATSPTIKHLVTQRGTPEAIGIEREFLRPNRLKLFYPAQGQVYLLDEVGGEWLVAGSEPLEGADLELVTTQRAKLLHTPPATTAVSDIVPTTTQAAPIAAVSQAEFRGMLKPPSKASVAKLTQTAHSTYVHTVSFLGEDFTILADWYTDNASNARLLAQKNRRDPHALLRLGEQILIPRELMRNPEPLPEAMVP
jgi:hypothetical protein